MDELLSWLGDAFSWAAGAIGALIGVIGAFASGFVDEGPTVYNGYVEANYVYVAATNPGRLKGLIAEEGQTVTEGQMLFSLDDDQYRASLSAAIAQQKAAEASCAISKPVAAPKKPMSSRPRSSRPKPVSNWHARRSTAP